MDSMNNPPGTETAVKILSVSPTDADHDTLCTILEQATPTGETSYRWMVHPASGVGPAAEMLAEQEIAIVISECNFFPDTWRTLLEYISALPDPPLLIVASRLADERLWAEALNLGAWDVLAKPFDKQEVRRVLATAWRYWRDRHELRTRKQQPVEIGRSRCKVYS